VARLRGDMMDSWMKVRQSLDMMKEASSDDRLPRVGIIRQIGELRLTTLIALPDIGARVR
jgi:hypothetical protein